ncbi:MAG: acyl-CoA dehydrogenase [Proteobacteria bacterium]|nr:acyl-CoA dehydrogenase [Pseudomonadota bacterium]
MGTVCSRRDIDFLLHEVLDVTSLVGRERYAMHDRVAFDAAIDLAFRLAEERLQPHASLADADEPHVVDGRVVQIAETGAALEALREAGFFAATVDEEQGGMQLPFVIGQACAAFFKGANVSTTGYLLLTRAAANLLEAHGTPDQKQRYMLAMNAGRFFGTMCLSEPDVGSSLADIRTRAMPRGDGTYAIRGNKMWISGGEHELSETIVHLVLAKLPDAPPGARGISLFIVPRHRLDGDGNPGEDNNVVLAGLNHKMGYRGITNCLLNFGESGETIGELVGEPHRGLAYMFHMMNEARIGVGLGATMLGYGGYLASLAYARERRQGRPLDGRDPHAPPIAIVEHPDVRRMLLQQKAYVEGGLALGLWCGLLVDEQKTAPEASARDHARRLLDILTPIAKAWPSEFCLEANKLAIQVLGGAGYTRDFPVERLYRDNRLNPIHEGTNGIQALDLLGRKAVMEEGACFDALGAEITAMTGQARDAGLDKEAQAVECAWDATSAAREATVQRMAQQGLAAALANATTFLHGFGHVVVTALWLRQAVVASRALPSASDGDADFYHGKVQAMRYMVRHELHLARAWLQATLTGDATVLETAAEWL